MPHFSEDQLSNNTYLHIIKSLVSNENINDELN